MTSRSTTLNNIIPWVALTSFVAGIATSIIASKIIIKDGKKNRKNGM